MKTKILKLRILMVLAAALLMGACNGIIHMEIPSGTPLWARSTVGGTAESVFNDVAVGSDGIYAVGWIGQGTIDLGNGVTATGVAAKNLLLVKYNKTGNPIWAISTINASGDSILYGIAITSDGIYATGQIGGGDYYFGNSVSIIGLPLGSHNGILIKYDLSGKALWIKVVSGPNDITFGQPVLYSNFLYIVGIFSGSGPFDFGNSVQISGPSNNNGFIVKFNLTGKAIWAKSTISGPSTEYRSVSVDDDGVYVAGDFQQGTIDFGNSISAVGNLQTLNPLLVKYSLDGSPEWAFSLIKCTCSSVRFQNIVNDKEFLYVTGNAYGIGAIGICYPVVRTIYDGSNCLVVKFDKMGVGQWARSLTAGNGPSYYYGLHCINNKVYICGFVSGYSTFSFGNKVNLDTYLEDNPIILKYDEYGVAQWASTVIPPADNSSGASLESIKVANDYLYAVGISLPGTLVFGRGVSVSGPARRNLLIVAYKK